MYGVVGGDAGIVHADRVAAHWPVVRARKGSRNPGAAQAVGDRGTATGQAGAAVPGGTTDLSRNQREIESGLRALAQAIA